MELIVFKFGVMGKHAFDFSKLNIMSRGIEVDQSFCDQYRIKYIYNRIENIDVLGMEGEVLQREVKDKMERNSVALRGRVLIRRGGCMLVEGGLKSVGDGHVVITTIFHFEDVYSMNMFIMKYPHKMWDHMSELYVLTN